MRNSENILLFLFFMEGNLEMIYKPINILPDNDFYATGKPVVITWNNSGDIMYYFQITIYNNATDALVYDSKLITTFTPKHEITQVLPLGIHKFKITVFNEKKESAVSNYQIFTIAPSPTLRLNLKEGDIIATQTLSLSAEYSHPTGTKHKYYRFILYDAYKNVIETSSYLYNSKFAYTYKTLLANEEFYYAQISVITYDNIEASSAMVGFKAVYLKPELRFYLQAETMERQPYVKLSWSVTRIIGEIAGTPVYINNEKLDCTKPGDKVYFDKGFVLNDDFTLNIWVEKIREDLEFLLLYSHPDKIYLTYYNKRVHVFKDNGYFLIHGMSEAINYTGKEQIMVRMQQEGKYIGVYAEIVQP